MASELAQARRVGPLVAALAILGLPTAVLAQATPAQTRPAQAATSPSFPEGADASAPTLQFPKRAVPTVQSPGFPGWGPHGKPLYYLMVLSNSTPGADIEFNMWYDRIHAPLVIESGDFVWAQRFQLSPVQVAGAELATREYLVIFAIETDNIEKAAAEVNARVKSPRNIRSMTMDYSSLMSVTFEAIGPPITQQDAQKVLAEEEAVGRVPRKKP